MLRLLACLLAFAPAPALADWTHKLSGLRMPDRIGDMRRGEVRDLSNGAELNVMVQYGGGNEPVTVYVYRSSHPSAALWFERTRIAMQANTGGFDDSAAPVQATLFGASAPNALRQSYAVVPGKGWKATAVTIADHGEWLVKVRVSSDMLDVAGVTAKMDRLLAAMTLPRNASARPLEPVAACDGASTSYRPAKAITGDAATKAVAEAAVIGVIAMAEARGTAGLVAEPAAWCRASTTLPANFVTLYRARTGTNWVALIGDSGMSIASNAAFMPDGVAKAGLYLNRPEDTAVIAALDAPPSPEQAFADHVVPLLSGQRQPVATLSTKK